MGPPTMTVPRVFDQVKLTIEGELVGALDPACLQAVVVGITDVRVHVDAIGSISRSERTVVGFFVVRRALR